jgi:hypothetical protein
VCALKYSFFISKRVKSGILNKSTNCHQVSAQHYNLSFDVSAGCRGFAAALTSARGVWPTALEEAQASVGLPEDLHDAEESNAKNAVVHFVKQNKRTFVQRKIARLVRL